MITGRLRWLALMAGSLLTLGVGGCGGTDFILGSLDLERYDASEALTQEIPYGGERIVVDVALGKVVIRGREEPGYVAWRPFLGIQAVKKVRGLKLEDVTLRITQEEGTIHIRSDVRADWIGRRLKLLPPGAEERVGWVELALSVPPGAALTVDVEAGTLDVEGIQGELSASVQLGKIVVRDSGLSSLEMRSEAGDLRAQGLSAERLEARSQMGSIVLSDAAVGSAVLSSELGDVTVDGMRGAELQVSTQMGSVTVRNSRWEGVRLESQLGGILVEDTEPGGGWVSTQMGGIRVALSPDEPLTIRAETQMGRIRLRGAERALPSEAVRWESAWPGQALTLRLGAAPGEGPQRSENLRLSTQVGSIEIVLIPSASP